MIEIKLQFKSVEEAVAALAKMAGLGGAGAKQAPVVPKVEMSAGTATPQVPATVQKSPRKPRSDAGRARGSYKDANAAVEAGTAKSVGSGTAAEAGSVPDAGNGGQQAPTQTSTPLPASVAPEPAAQEANALSATVQTPAAEATEADCQAAIKKLYETDGNKMARCEQVVSRFGVKRIKDLLPAQRGEFVAKVNAVLNGEEI